MTTLEYAKKFKPGSRTVTFRYGIIQGYRSPTSWGFNISDNSATWAWFELYTCPRKSAKRLFENHLKPTAEERGFKVLLVVDAVSGLGSNLVAPKSRLPKKP